MKRYQFSWDELYTVDVRAKNEAEARKQLEDNHFVGKKLLEFSEIQLLDEYEE